MLYIQQQPLNKKTRSGTNVRGALRGMTSVFRTDAAALTVGSKMNDLRCGRSAAGVEEKEGAGAQRCSRQPAAHVQTRMMGRLRDDRWLSSAALGTVDVWLVDMGVSDRREAWGCALVQAVNAGVAEEAARVRGWGQDGMMGRRKLHTHPGAAFWRAAREAWTCVFEFIACVEYHDNPKPAVAPARAIRCPGPGSANSATHITPSSRPPPPPSLPPFFFLLLPFVLPVLCCRPALSAQDVDFALVPTDRQ